MENVQITAKVWGKERETEIANKLAERKSEPTVFLDQDFYPEPHGQETIFRVTLLLTPKDPNAKVSDTDLGEAIRLLLEASGDFLDNLRVTIS